MLIEVAGIDGSGKSTLVAHLQGFLSVNGVQCVERVIRSTHKRVLLDIARDRGCDHWREVFDVSSVELAHALEMTAAVYQQVLPINPRYQVIVTDTYIARWLATASMWGAANLDQLADIYRVLPPPDISIHLTVDPETAYRRLMSRPKRDHKMKLGSSERLHSYADSFNSTRRLLNYSPVFLSTETDLDITVRNLLDLVQEARCSLARSTAPRTD